jgi:hypothetical protein
VSAAFRACEEPQKVAFWAWFDGHLENVGEQIGLSGEFACAIA